MGNCMHKQREKAKDTQALRNRLIQDQVGLVSFYDVDTPSESKTDSHNGFGSESESKSDSQKIKKVYDNIDEIDLESFDYDLL